MIITFSDLALESRGCEPGSLGFRAKFKFNTDISQIFPYVNAVAENPLYSDKPHYVKFQFNEFYCTLYPDNGVMVLVNDEAHAIKAINKLIEFLNDLYSKKDSIEPNNKFFKHIPALNIYKLLSKTNCKKCGYPTCMSFAVDLSKRETELEKCPGMTDPENNKAVELKSLLFD